jgi:hypothetical protein
MILSLFNQSIKHMKYKITLEFDTTDGLFPKVVEEVIEQGLLGQSYSMATKEIKPKAPKLPYKQKNENMVMKTFEGFFEQHPDLMVVPVYVWGRCYKYELSGHKFESEEIDTFEDFDSYSIQGITEYDLYSADVMLSDYLYQHNEYDIYDYGNEARQAFLNDTITGFDLKDYQEIFDSKGGMALIIARQADGSLAYEYRKADSPE